jgi:hypothetical protein
MLMCIFMYVARASTYEEKNKAFHEKAHVIVFFPNNYLIFPP